MISVQNGPISPVKVAFCMKKNLLITLAYLNKMSSLNGINYFPTQKSLKILPNISSTSTFPTIFPK